MGFCSCSAEDKTDPCPMRILLGHTGPATSIRVIEEDMQNYGKDKGSAKLPVAVTASGDKTVSLCASSDTLLGSIP